MSHTVWKGQRQQSKCCFNYFCFHLNAKHIPCLQQNWWAVLWVNQYSAFPHATPQCNCDTTDNLHSIQTSDLPKKKKPHHIIFIGVQTLAPIKTLTHKSPWCRVVFPLQNRNLMWTAYRSALATKPNVKLGTWLSVSTLCGVTSPRVTRLCLESLVLNCNTKHKRVQWLAPPPPNSDYCFIKQ